MAIVKWNPMRTIDPWDDMRRLQNELNSLFDFESFSAGTGLFDRTVSPALDLIETSAEFIVTVELPGLKEDDISLSLTGNVLTLKGEKKFQNENNDDGKYYRKESWAGSFQRTLSLPSGVEAENISALLADGILSVTLPKKEEEQTKSIDIKVQ